MVTDNYFLNRFFILAKKLKLNFGKLLKTRSAVVDFESKILLHDVFINYFHGPIICGSIVGNL